MIIYKYTNKINGKVYIGKTEQRPSTRRNQHIFDAKNGSTCIFHGAIRKYGIDNFEYTEIDGANSSSELNYKEIHYIHMYNSLKPNGYNYQLGNRISIPEYKRIEGINKSVLITSKPVIALCVNTSKEITFSSVSECERVLNIPRNTVYEILNGRREYTHRNGFYFRYKNKDTIVKKLKIRQERKVKRIDNRTKEIKIYNSANETKIDGFNPDIVRNACNRVRKFRNRTVGYSWEYIYE